MPIPRHLLSIERRRCRCASALIYPNIVRHLLISARISDAVSTARHQKRVEVSHVTHQQDAKPSKGRRRNFPFLILPPHIQSPRTCPPIEPSSLAIAAAFQQGLDRQRLLVRDLPVSSRRPISSTGLGDRCKVQAVLTCHTVVLGLKTPVLSSTSKPTRHLISSQTFQDLDFPNPPVPVYLTRSRTPSPKPLPSAQQIQDSRPLNLSLKSTTPQLTMATKICLPRITCTPKTPSTPFSPLPTRPNQGGRDRPWRISGLLTL